MKILILSASSGAGHVMAGKAVEEAFVEGGTVHEVLHADSNVYSSKLLQKLYADAYFKMANSAGHALGWFYDYLLGEAPKRRKLYDSALQNSSLTRFLPHRMLGFTLQYRACLDAGLLHLPRVVGAARDWQAQGYAT